MFSRSWDVSVLLSDDWETKGGGRTLKDCGRLGEECERTKQEKGEGNKVLGEILKDLCEKSERLNEDVRDHEKFCVKSICA